MNTEWLAGYRAGLKAGSAGAGSPHSARMRAILGAISGAGLLYDDDGQHKHERVRPAGSVYACPQGDKYQMELYGKGTFEDLAAICGDLAQALGVEWCRLEHGDGGRAFVVIPHQPRKG